jgi:hypothetical protein
MEFWEGGIGLRVQQRDAGRISVYDTVSLSSKTLLHLIS